MRLSLAVAVSEENWCILYHDLGLRTFNLHSWRMNRVCGPWIGFLSYRHSNKKYKSGFKKNIYFPIVMHRISFASMLKKRKINVFILYLSWKHLEHPSRMMLALRNTKMRVCTGYFHQMCYIFVLLYSHLLKIFHYSKHLAILSCHYYY